MAHGLREGKGHAHERQHPPALPAHLWKGEEKEEEKEEEEEEEEEKEEEREKKEEKK